jgi:excisionase family DNA binding protein
MFVLTLVSVASWLPLPRRLELSFRLFRLESGGIGMAMGNTVMSISSKSDFPQAREIAAAVQGQRALAAFLCTKEDMQRIEIYDEKNKAHAVELPTSALRLLMDVLGELALGNSVRVVPVHAELTTQEAADLLSVSRPHLVKLLEEGALPHHKAGRHRRVFFSDLMAYKQQRDDASHKALNELASLSEELGLGY